MTWSSPPTPSSCKKRNKTRFSSGWTSKSQRKYKRNQPTIGKDTKRSTTGREKTSRKADFLLRRRLWNPKVRIRIWINGWTNDYMQIHQAGPRQNSWNKKTAFNKATREFRNLEKSKQKRINQQKSCPRTPSPDKLNKYQNGILNLCLGLKKDEVKPIITENKIDILCLQVTELDSGFPTNILSFKGYTLEMESNANKLRSGLYIKDSLRKF